MQNAMEAVLESLQPARLISRHTDELVQRLRTHSQAPFSRFVVELLYCRHVVGLLRGGLCKSIIGYSINYACSESDSVIKLYEIIGSSGELTCVLFLLNLYT